MYSNIGMWSLILESENALNVGKCKLLVTQTQGLQQVYEDS